MKTMYHISDSYYDGASKIFYEENQYNMALEDFKDNVKLLYTEYAWGALEKVTVYDSEEEGLECVKEEDLRELYIREKDETVYYSIDEEVEVVYYGEQEEWIKKHTPIKLSRHDAEYEVNEIVDEIIYENDLEDDFYGDCYPDDLRELVNNLTRAENLFDYELLIEEIRDTLQSMANPIVIE